MIVGELKPSQEIISSILGYNKVLVLGCGTCVSVCLSGGDKAARNLVTEMEQLEEYRGKLPEFEVNTIERQCEVDLVSTYLEITSDVDAILSLGCGAGVQTIVSAYSRLPVIPALNTTFLGALEEPGVWREKCRGCGDCVLNSTGGICPVARCAKQIFNGPCGGSSGGKCELDESVDCAWHLIIERLNILGRLEDYEKIHPPKDWSWPKAQGPREYKHR